MEAIVLFSALLTGYLLLRSRGGEGLDIKFKLAPASTSKGKADRLALSAALAVMSTGLIFVLAHQRGETRTSVLLSLLAGAVVGLVFFASYLKDKK